MSNLDKCTLINHSSIIYYISNNFTYMPSIACFNLYDTLVKRKNSASSNMSDIIIYDEIVNITLNNLNNKASFVIFTDQINKSFNSIKLLLKKITILLKFPFIIICSTKDNCFKKPNTNMWKILENLYKFKEKTINVDKSLYIGSQAGDYIKSTKNYNSDVDRAFAYNLGLKFTIPCSFFTKDILAIKWRWNNNVLNNNQKRELLETSKKLSEPDLFVELKKINTSKNPTDTVVFLILAPPSSGKTTLCNRIKESWDKEMQHITNKLLITDRNNYTSSNQYYNAIDIFLQNNRSIIIKNDFYTECGYDNLFKLLNKYKIFTLVINIDINHNIPYLLNCIKIQVSKYHTNERINFKKINEYYKRTDVDKISNRDISTHHNVLYINYPFVIRERKEFWYKY